ncbi:Hypothetical_protein [Hexamita inflata]|uniref:Hypothetical_protein n=1 Tax=Hexamita inflata TaxID=28002 RepID=A0AA86URK4_9EUKA|nr:Hypothetical protein HINF_LOCUS49456 [Hexamita inflata]CAI9973407.1 Hypothetical protein HINF_LOCUS61052 [Hexamita inflata]
MTYYQSDCLNACSNGYCNNTYSYSYGRNMYNCVQNPSGIFNTLDKCNNNCTSGYCNQTYNNNHSRYEYNCTNNDAGIYNSYNSCSDNCYDGYCDSSYSYSHSRYEYSCVKYTTDNNACYLMLLLIPAFFSFIITIVCCCYKKNKVGRTTKTIQKQALKQQRDELIIQTVTEVTLPNGQNGLFVPLTQTQQDKLQRTNQIQIYYPQPIYQPQPVQMVAHNSPQFQTVQNPQVQIIKMPIMPSIPL